MYVKYKIEDLLNIVCHSMGYAHALGAIKVLQDIGLKIGAFYCLAPQYPVPGATRYFYRIYKMIDSLLTIFSFLYSKLPNMIHIKYTTICSNIDILLV